MIDAKIPATVLGHRRTRPARSRDSIFVRLSIFNHDGNIIERAPLGGRNAEPGRKLRRIIPPDTRTVFIVTKILRINPLHPLLRTDQDGLGVRAPGFDQLLPEGGIGQGRQNTYDRHDDHQLDQRETALHMLVFHWSVLPNPETSRQCKRGAGLLMHSTASALLLMTLLARCPGPQMAALVQVLPVQVQPACPAWQVLVKAFLVLSLARRSFLSPLSLAGAN